MKILIAVLFYLTPPLLIFIGTMMQFIGIDKSIRRIIALILILPLFIAFELFGEKTAEYLLELFGEMLIWHMFIWINYVALLNLFTILLHMLILHKKPRFADFRIPFAFAVAYLCTWIFPL